jgi:glycerol-3-phosphate dehydrogenase (NAD(P)+)
VGEQLGKGRKLGEIVAEMRTVAEGIHTCSVVLELARRFEVPMPISQEIHRVLYEGLSAIDAYRGLVRHHPPGSEIE